MFLKQKISNIEKNKQRLNIKLGISYFLLLFLFILLLIFL